MIIKRSSSETERNYENDYNVEQGSSTFFLNGALGMIETEALKMKRKDTKKND